MKTETGETARLIAAQTGLSMTRARRAAQIGVEAEAIDYAARNPSPVPAPRKKHWYDGMSPGAAMVLSDFWDE